MKRLIFLLLAILIIAWPSRAQVPVALLPASHQQFFSANGVPLAGGCISTFAAGTSTPQATYTDVTGLIQNANPLTLDGGGFATIYLANSEYKIQVNAAPASGSCSSSNLGAQIWVQDNVSAWQPINNISNIFFSGVTSDPAGVAGEIGYRSDLPCFRVFTTIWDCLVQTNLTQTLTNKTLTSPVISSPLISSPAISGGGSWSGSPSILTAVLNGVTAGPATSYTVATTDENRLISFGSGGPVAVTLPAASTAGFGFGTKFSFQSINSGTVVTITPNSPSEIDGVASLSLSTNQGVDVYSDGVNYWTQRGSGNSGYKFETAVLTPATVGNTTTPTNLIPYTVPANEIAIGKTFYFDAQGIIGATSTPNFLLTVVLDGTAICQLNLTLAAANTQPWALHGFFTGLSVGSSGSVTGCHLDWSSTLGGHVGNEAGAGSPAQSVTVNTTVSHTLSFQITWGTANTLDTVTQNTLILYRIG